MAKLPPVPPGSQSPFGQRMSEPRVEEKPVETLGPGCGNPSCQMCYPERNKMSSLYDEMRRAQRAMYEEGARSWAIPTPPPASSEAREAVEDFILEVPPKVDWSDVVGNEAARAALIEAIETPIKHKDLFAFYKMRPLKGVLLWGPPGCGKTMFAKAAAGAIAKLHGTSAEMLIVNGASLQSRFVGETEQTIRSLFTYAKEYRKAKGHPLAIFIDEADAILPPRSRGIPWQVSNVSTFLAEMDGVEDSGAFVILASNRPEAIDEALLRDGRCDRKIKIERPSLDAAKVILTNALHEVPLHGEEFLPDIVVQVLDYFVHPERKIGDYTNGELSLTLTLANIMSGAMLVGLASRAKSKAFARDLANNTQLGITLAELFAAVDDLVQENRGVSHDFAIREMLGELT